MDASMRSGFSACLALCFSMTARAEQPQPVQGYYYPQPPYFAPYVPYGYQAPVYPAAQPAAPAPSPASADMQSTAPSEVAPGGRGLSARSEDIAKVADRFTLRRARLGPVLATAEGRTLYVSTADAKGDAACRGGCSGLWIPFLTTDSTVPTAPFGTVQREDGSRQWSYDGRPLYQWVGDEREGDVTGDGVDGTWFAVRVRPG
jgi:predicted lipoprotein with Yx(FWY)xxD motif